MAPLPLCGRRTMLDYTISSLSQSSLFGFQILLKALTFLVSALLVWSLLLCSFLFDRVEMVRLARQLLFYHHSQKSACRILLCLLLFVLIKQETDPPSKLHRGTKKKKMRIQNSSEEEWRKLTKNKEVDKEITQSWWPYNSVWLHKCQRLSDPLKKESSLHKGK